MEVIMNSYSNSFACALDNSGEEFVIQFSQIRPVFTENHTISEAVSEPVCSIVMSPERAKNLAKCINDIFEKSSSPVGSKE